MDQNPWSIIKRGLTKVINIAQGIRQTKFGSDEYMLLYTTIENCSLIYPHKLLATYKDVVCHAYVNATVLPCLRDSSSELLLSEIVRTFTNHQHVVRRTLRLFGSLDNNPFFPSTDLFKLDGFACFRDVVYRELKSKITNVVVCLIAREREGEQIDRVLLKNVLDIFVVIGKGNSTDNENGLEESILKESVYHYLREAASDWMVECSCLDYILKVDECLKREKDLFADYLPRSSQRKLHEIFHRELLAAYATLLENEHKVEDLSTIFTHLKRIPLGLELVSNNFKLNITSRGTALVKQAEESANNNKVRLQDEKRDAGVLPEHVFVKELIALHDKFTAYVNVCFQNHHLFHMALKDSFRIICNEGVSGNSSAELFASFCDHILRKGGNEKLISDEAIGDTLEKVVKLLTYISDKDLFAEFYRKRLSRRLLFDKSSNVEHERSILTKMKQEFGVQFTSKMEGMVTDFTLAKENQTKFDEYLFFGHNRNLNPRIDLAVTVLTTGFWPTYKSFDLNLPVEMATCVSVFREFYQTKTKYRKLSFIYSLGTCNVNGNFDQKTIELNVTTYQAATLLLFNTSDRLSYREIVTQLNLPDDDIVRLLHSLSCGRYKILSKEPDTKTISPTDTFEYNSKFTDKMRRIKIPLTPVVDEKKKVIEDVCKDRRYTIDASIVRIMKSRKVLSSQKLIAECVEQLNSMFKPDVKAIKERIEDLIVREYLERDKNSSSKFKYLA